VDIEPPYTAVIFTSTHTDDTSGYDEAALAMRTLAAEQPGYLGIETVGDAGHGITVSYWATEADAAAWRRNAEHAAVQAQGRRRWYASYDIRVATVHRHHRFDA
jgi:heme-degrading monooxygenase HmoA